MNHVRRHLELDFNTIQLDQDKFISQVKQLKYESLTLRLWEIYREVSKILEI